MKKLFLGIAVVLALGMMAVTAFAIEGEGGVKLTGKHYNLQILGKDKDDMPVGDTENRHTIFVPLDGISKIYMQQTEDPNDDQFKVLDANGFDNDGCRFELAAGHYNVFARALGKPGKRARVRVFYEDELGNELLYLGYVDLAREKGRPVVKNINKFFYWTITICDENGENCVDYKNYWVFDIEGIEDYWWEYTNEGLRLLQVRFYPCELLGVDTLDPNAPNLCVDENGEPLESGPPTPSPAPGNSSNLTTTWGDIKE